MPKSTTKAKTDAERSAKQKEKKNYQGLVRRAYWVPETKQKEARELIKNLTNEGELDE